MPYNKFHINIFLRIILIILSSFLFVFFVERDDNILTSIFIALTILIQTIFLIKYINRTNRDLAEFLIHLQQGDTSAAFRKENITKTFKGLLGSFDKINTDFKKIKSEQIQKEHYLNYVIDNIKTGLIAFNDSGKVEFVNNQARIFLSMRYHPLLNINNLDSEFVRILNDTKTSESHILKKVINDELLYLTFSLSEFKIDRKTIRFFTIHNVKQEIETNEIESWQKITRVLTHEMMNSITPITSLAHAIIRYLKNDNKIINLQDINDELISDILINADIIENRGKGLLEFINNYRTITKLPKPKFEEIETKVILEKAIQLFIKEIKEKGIAIEINNKQSDHIFLADKSMVEQVLINLLKNAIESLTNTSKPVIKISSFKNAQNKTIITVQDNGEGISPEVLENIFTPFFTTKVDGSGIGLSLSRQIMHLHNGNISVKSEPNNGTIFTLYF